MVIGNNFPGYWDGKTIDEIQRYRNVTVMESWEKKVTGKSGYNISVEILRRWSAIFYGTPYPTSP
jgi:hypothetical protein